MFLLCASLPGTSPEGAYILKPASLNPDWLAALLSKKQKNNTNQAVIGGYGTHWARGCSILLSTSHLFQFLSLWEAPVKNDVTASA